MYAMGTSALLIYFFAYDLALSTALRGLAKCIISERELAPRIASPLLKEA